MAKTAIFTTGITSKNHQEKNFSQGKCEFMKFLFLLIDKIKIYFNFVNYFFASPTPAYPFLTPL
jgi:hypothetical protein